ncbi:MAG TPA: PocR ligand-binding domain-containing protein [Spirochaetota bacterium]|nr:PocR ligand-binding domain-containing protein [Spirochaetota bacterium]HQO22359.1 PocR ligand-binding domain-containing protein [Spirochaetota bacterium]HQQ23153.1 PocR ligand-binding domain-containing protein [Spirochaetota bacterium]
MVKLTGKNILLVEDEILIAECEKNELEEYGYSVFLCLSGENAVETVFSGQHNFDLILMDIDLGKNRKDGIRTAEEILEKKDIPIIFLSSHTEKEIVERTESITSFGYVVKNSGKVVLDASIKMAFRLHHEKTEVQAKQHELISANEKLNAAYEEMEAANEELAATNEELISMNNQLIDAENEIVKREILLSSRLDSLLNPESNSNGIDLKNAVDIEAVQSILNNFCSVTGMVTALLDLDGKILISTGWQDICTKFHRVNDRSSLNCTESDLHLSKMLQSDEFADYKCKNGLWDVVTPLYINGKHVGNIFTGQFFYDDDVIDEIYFEKQAETFGFNKEKYIEALRKVPVYNREIIRSLMLFLVNFFKLVSRLSFSNILLAKESSENLRSKEKLQQNEIQIKQQLEEKEMILREVHHRIKNNISNISNLLKLQAASTECSETKEKLHEAIGGVDSMKFIYEKLLLSDNYRDISIKEYLEDLVKAIVENFPEKSTIAISQNIEDFQMNAKTVFLLGTIVNELITNSLKYAFSGTDYGLLSITLSKQNNEIELIVSDNGSGFSANFNPDKSSGFGLTLINMLTKQLQGSFKIENNNGIKSFLRFSV